MQRKWKDTSGRAAYILYVKGQSTSCPIYGCPPTAEGKWFLDYLKDKNVKHCKIIIRKKKRVARAQTANLHHFAQAVTCSDLT